MPGWFNQCPTASGITDSSRDRQSSAATGKKRNVDLVHWRESERHARLIELKWKSDNPRSALLQILRYGAAYMFCRVHRNALPLSGRPLMDACHISLEVVAPASYYYGSNAQDIIARHDDNSLGAFAGSKINGLSMTLKTLAFPKTFEQIFGNQGGASMPCDLVSLTDRNRKGRLLIDAFDKLAPM